MHLIRPIRLLLVVTVFALLAGSGCYTRLHAPGYASGEEGEEAGYTDPVPVNADIPSARLDSYDWLFYYQLPWWMDENDVLLGDGPGNRYVPEEYRQRFPETSSYPGSFSGGYAPTVTGSSLAKQPADSTAAPAPAKDNRRSFTAGSSTNTQATVPAGSSATPNNDRRPEGSTTQTTGREQPRRR